MGLCPWWVHNDNACVCPLTGCKSRCHLHSGLRRKQGRHLGPHLQKPRRNKESPLHNGCASRSQAFCGGRDPRTLEMLAVTLREPSSPGVLTLLPIFSPYLFRMQGDVRTWESPQEDCPRLVLGMVTRASQDICPQVPSAPEGTQPSWLESSAQNLEF